MSGQEQCKWVVRWSAITHRPLRYQYCWFLHISPEVTTRINVVSVKAELFLLCTSKLLEIENESVLLKDFGLENLMQGETETPVPQAGDPR